ncbi:YfhO family protein [Georgenia sp. SUBG003]|uniref:YfhO family protein n=1 Tax=Georgenia sp. SUBG003 TaxID=1497974 RepID=UPI003AB7A5C4
MLVVADGLHDGWEASVDGEPVDIVRADYAMRGVPVPAGDHVVELAYRPVGWGPLSKVAAATGVAVVGLWGALAWRDRRDRRRRAVSSTA